MQKIYSVVIPAYNAEKTIEACLASVLAQTLAPLEVIVVDDCSVDATERVVESCQKFFSYAGIKLRYIKLEENGGPSKARNKGITLATGNSVAFLDADDYWHREKLEIVDTCSTGIECCLITHDYSESSSFDIEKSHNLKRFTFKTIPLFRLLLRNHAASSCVVICHLSKLQFDESMSFCEDYDLCLRVAEESPIIKILAPPLTKLGRPQLSAGGLSGNRFKMRIGELRVYYQFCKRFWLLRCWLYPGLVIFSALKEVRSRTLQLVRHYGN